MFKANKNWLLLRNIYHQRNLLGSVSYRDFRETGPRSEIKVSEPNNAYNTLLLKMHTRVCVFDINFSNSLNQFVWEVISNTCHSVSSQYQKPRSSSKILRYTSYFQLSSQCLICDETLCLVFDVTDQTWGRVFPPISKHREVGWKNEAQPSFFNQLRGVWK